MVIVSLLLSLQTMVTLEFPCNFNVTKCGDSSQFNGHGDFAVELTQMTIAQVSPGDCDRKFSVAEQGKKYLFFLEQF